MLNKYNKLFKQLVSAGLVSPNPAGARWFGQMVARLHAGLIYHNHILDSENSMLMEELNKIKKGLGD